MPKQVALTKSKPYAEFTHERDRALEKILHVHLCAVDLVIDKLKQKTMALAQLNPRTVTHEFNLAALQIATLMHRMRHEAYLLAHVGEAEALARALGKTHKVNPKGPKPETPSGGSVDDRVGLALTRLKHKVDDALHLSKVLGDSHQDTVARIGRAFPSSRPKPSRTRGLVSRRLQEASRDGTEKGERRKTLTTGYYDQEAWDDIIEDYRAEELPEDIFARGPEDRVIFFDLDSGDSSVRYQWEVEQEITEDFVHQVREGTNDAALENGIEDFEWIAVLDDHTDECCADRDGHSSSEIEDMLDSGELDAEVSEAIVAPAHFNCRCKSAPLVNDLPDVGEPDFMGFEDWLDAKAAA